MNQPLKYSLEFPRSGQRLRVSIPREMAETKGVRTLEASRTERNEAQLHRLTSERGKRPA